MEKSESVTRGDRAGSELCTGDNTIIVCENVCLKGHGVCFCMGI